MDYPVSDVGSLLQEGKFSDGDASQGIQSSIDKSAHMNAVYDEIIAAITGLGLAPDETSFNQLSQAINIAAPRTQITYHYVDISAANPVPGWVLCDGAGGTPALIDRVVMGAGGTHAVGDTGGELQVNTSTRAAVTPTITVENHTISETESAEHDHSFGFEVGASRGSPDNPPGIAIQSQTTQPDAKTALSGGSQGHAHTAISSAVPEHYHFVNTLPPFFALAPFIRADYLADIVTAGGI